MSKVICECPNHVTCIHKRNLEKHMICGIDANTERCRYAVSGADYIDRLNKTLKEV